MVFLKDKYWAVGVESLFVVRPLRPPDFTVPELSGPPRGTSAEAPGASPLLYAAPIEAEPPERFPRRPPASMR